MSRPNLLIVAQAGRLEAEAVLFAATLRRDNPDIALYVAEPQPGPLWPDDPRITDAGRAVLGELGARVVPFDSRDFGAAYPYGNKIEALRALPPGEPFVFFDTDTVITGDLRAIPFDFDRPCASLRRTGTWPVIELYGPGYAAIWGALYARFGLDLATSLDLAQPGEHWERYLYFNAGWFFGADPEAFGLHFRDIAVAIRDDPPAEVALQPLDPWLDQVALPLVIHRLGGARLTIPPGLLDGTVSHHYRALPLLFAQASDDVLERVAAAAAPNRVKSVLKAWPPFHRMLYRGDGARARALFADAPPRDDATARNRLRRAGLWMR